MATIQGSEELYAHLKESEGFSATPYKDFAGIDTIGYGDTGGDMSKPLTEEEAETRMRARVQTFADELKQRITVPLSQKQQDAILGFTYNTGTKLLDDNDFFSDINSGNFDTVYDRMLKYNKARDPKTGKLVKLPGLVARRKKEAQWWREGQTASEGSDIGAMMAGFYNTTIEEAQSQVEDISQALSGFYEKGASQLDKARSQLTVAQNTADETVTNLQRDALEISRKFSISLDQAKAYLYDTDKAKTEFELEKRVISDNYPALTKHASNPINTPVVLKNLEGAKNIERQAMTMSPLYEDFKTAILRNTTQAKEYTLQLGMGLGIIPVREGVAALREVMGERTENVYSPETVSEQRNLETAQEQFSSRINNALRILQKAASMPLGERDKLIPKLSEYLYGSTMTAHAAVKYAEAVLSNYRGAALSSAESAGTFLAPFLGGAAGAAVGSAVPVAGSFVGGLAGAYSMGALVQFGAYMQEEMMNFRDPTTGEVDIEGFFSDEKMMAKVRSKAKVYALTSASFDVIQQLIGGLPLLRASKPIVSTGAGAARTAAKKVATTVVEGVGQAASEGAAEVVGRSAADYSAGELTRERLAENFSQGAAEAAMSLPSGISHQVLTQTGHYLSSGVEKAYSYAGEKVNKRRAAKVVDTVDKVNKANDNYNRVQKLRASVEENPTTKEYPDQTAEYVNTAVKEHSRVKRPSEDAPVDEAAPYDIDEATVDQTVSEMEEQLKDSVTLTATELDAAFISLGVDPDQALQDLSPAIYNEYVRARQNKGSFRMSLGDWFRVTEGRGELDAIARYGNSDLNALEADDIAAAIEENPRALFQPEDQEAPQELPPSFITLEPEDAMDEPITRPVELMQRFADEETQTTYRKILGGLKRSLKETAVEPEAIEQAALVQLTHLQARSERLGVPISELQKKLRFGKTSKAGVRGSTDFGPLPYSPTESIAKIVFNKSAQLNTVLHEFGHVWLNEMGEDWDFIHSIAEESLTPTQRDYKGVMQDAAKILGLESLADLTYGRLDNSVYRKVQETFALTTEKYFLEGKFKNKTILRIMERLRSWLTDIASQVASSYGGTYAPLQLSPEVSRIFEVLLDAGDKAEQYVTPMFEDPIFAPSMLGKQAPAYFEAVKNAQDQAIGEAYSRMFNVPWREREKIIAEALDYADTTAQQEVDRRFSMQVLNAYDRAYDDYRNGTAPDIDPRISYDSIETYLFGGNAEAASMEQSRFPKQMVTGKKKAGQDVREVMAALSINDSDEMLSLIYEAGRRTELIEQRASEILDENFPVLKSDEEISRIAVEAVQNDGKEKLLRAQMKIMAQQFLGALKTGIESVAMPPRFAKKMAKEAALNDAITLISEANAYGFSPEGYLAESNRLGRKAAKQFKAGDVETAFDTKYDELKFFHAYREGRKVQRELARTKRTIERIKKYSGSATAARVYDAQVIAYAADTVSRIRAGNVNVPPFTIDGLANGYAIPTSQVETVNKNLEAFKLAMVGRTVDDMPTSAYVQFGKFVSSVISAARNARTIELEGRRQMIDDVATQIANDIGPRRDSDPTSDISAIRASLTNARTLLSSFMGEEAFAKSALARVMNAVFDNESVLRVNFTQDRKTLGEVFSKAAKKDKGMAAVVAPWIRRIPYQWNWKEQYLKDAVISNSDELNHTFKNMNEVLMSLLYMGSESGAKKFLLGGPSLERGPYVPLTIDQVPDESRYWRFIDRLIAEGKLNKEHFDALDAIWRIFDRLYPLVKDANRYVTGSEMGKVEGRTVKTPWGDYKGGYFKLNPDAKYESLNRDLSTDPPNKSMVEMFPSADTSLTKNRKEVFYPLNLDMTKLPSQLMDAYRLAYLVKPMYDVGKILSHPLVKGSIEERRPGAYASILVPWFDDVMMQQFSRPDDHPLNTAARYLRQNMYVSLFLGEYKPVVRQLIGLSPAASMVGVYGLARAGTDFAINPAQTMREIREKSPRMRERFAEQAKNNIRSFEQMSINFDYISRTTGWAEQAAFLPIQMMQTAVDSVVWQAAYEQGLEVMGLTEKQAIARADNVVETSQGSSNISSRAGIQRGTDFQRLATVLSTPQMAIFNMSMEKIMRAETRTKKVAALGALLPFTVFIPMLLNQMIGELDLSAEPEEEDPREKKRREDSFWQDMARNSAAEFLDGYVPILSRPASSFLRFGNFQFSPAFDYARKSLTSATSAVRNASRGVDLSTRELTGLLNTFTLLSGAPLPIIRQGIEIQEGLTPADEREAQRRIRRRQLERARREDR